MEFAHRLAGGRGALERDLGLVDGLLEVVPQRLRAAVEEVVRDEAEDRDAQARGGRDEGFADAAADLGDRELLGADELEAAHDADDGAEQAEQRRERDDGAQQPLAGAGFLERLFGAELHGGHGFGAAVGEAGAERDEEGRSGALRALPGRAVLAEPDFPEGFAESLVGAEATDVTPVEQALGHGREGDDKADEDRPHDGSAFEEGLYEHVGEGHGHWSWNWMEIS